MALTIAFLVSLIVVANAGFVWVDEHEHNWSPFQHIKMPNMNFPPIPKPQLPRFPGFPPGFPFAGFPNIQFPTIQIPSPDEIENVKPGPNQFYNGVAVKSRSGVTRDKDGNLVKTGGTTILVNDNGEVIKKQVGKNPPNLNDPIIIPPMPKMPEFKPFEMPIMPPMLPIPPIKPFIIDPVKIENHIPGDGEHFEGVSVSTYSHSEDIDGVKTSGGGSSKVVNVDGEVEKEAVHYGQGDKQ